MFRPGPTADFFANEHSIVDINNKKGEINNLNSELINLESSIGSLISDLDSKESLALSTEHKTNLIKESMVDTSFKLHIPSILVFLEQEAKAKDVDILIEFGSIKTFNGEIKLDQDMGDEYEDSDFMGEDTEEFEDYEDFEDDIIDDPLGNEGMGGPEYDDEDLDLDNDFDEDTSSESETDEDMSEEDPNDSDEETDITEGDDTSTDGDTSSVNVPSIPGVDVTVVPIQIKGTYNKIRSFIQALDEIDFIENSSIQMTSDGNIITAKIILNVFHVEGGMNN